MKKIRETGFLLGVVAGISSIFLWFVLNFYNPYSSGNEFRPLVNTFLTLFLPACVAIIASLTSKTFLMLIAFLWSLPISLYLIGTPGIFALFGVTCILYLISFLFMLLARKRSELEQMVELNDELNEFTKMHDEFMTDWNKAMRSGDTSSLEKMTKDYYVAFFKGSTDKPILFNRQEAVSGMKQSVKNFKDAKKKFENRVIRLKDNENAVVFYEQLIDKDGEIVARLFTIKSWQFTSGNWMIVREIEESIS